MSRQFYFSFHSALFLIYITQKTYLRKFCFIFCRLRSVNAQTIPQMTICSWHIWVENKHNVTLKSNTFVSTNARSLSRESEKERQRQCQSDQRKRQCQSDQQRKADRNKKKKMKDLVASSKDNCKQANHQQQKDNGLYSWEKRQIR